MSIAMGSSVRTTVASPLSPWTWAIAAALVLAVILCFGFGLGYGHYTGRARARRVMLVGAGLLSILALSATLAVMSWNGNRVQSGVESSITRIEHGYGIGFVGSDDQYDGLHRVVEGESDSSPVSFADDDGDGAVVHGLIRRTDDTVVLYVHDSAYGGYIPYTHARMPLASGTGRTGHTD